MINDNEEEHISTFQSLRSAQQPADLSFICEQAARPCFLKSYLTELNMRQFAEKRTIRHNEIQFLSFFLQTTTRCTFSSVLQKNENEEQ